MATVATKRARDACTREYGNRGAIKIVFRVGDRDDVGKEEEVGRVAAATASGLRSNTRGIIRFRNSRFGEAVRSTGLLIN